MLRIVNVEEIERLLRSVPGLVDRLERSDPDLLQEVRKWFVEIERALENNRMPVVSAVAGLRGEIASAERGLVPSRITVAGKPTRRKILSAVVGAALREAGETVTAAVAQDRARIAEAERVCRQILARGVAEGAVPRSSVHGPDAQAQLGEMWKRMAQHPEMGQYVTHTEGLVGPYDALLLLDRCLTADRR